LAAGVVFYFDHRLDQISPANRQLVHVPLSEGVAIALRHVGKPRIIRVFAFSSHMIQPILQDLGVKAQQCRLLLYEPAQEGAADSTLTDTALAYAPIDEWDDMMRNGSFAELSVNTQPFYPLQYFVMLDDRALLLGQYLVQDYRFPKCEVQEPCLMLDETPEGKILLRKYLEVFDRLHDSKLSSSLEPVAATSAA
jgi:hypothetical protein